MERVTYREERHRLDGIYDNNFADNTVRNTFIEQGAGQTLWKVETEFKFKTLLMRILGTVMKKNSSYALRGIWTGSGRLWKSSKSIISPDCFFTGWHVEEDRQPVLPLF